MAITPPKVSGNLKAGAKAAAPAAKAAPAAAPAVAPRGAAAKSAGRKNVDNLLASEEAKAFNPDNVKPGSMQGTLEFICSLGDPSEKDNADFVKVGKDGSKGKDKRVYPRIVGYRFKILADQKIPDFGSTSRFNGSRLNTAEDLTRWRDAKAGEVVDFTRVEVGALLSQPGFNMQATGGEHPVRLQVHFARIADISKIDSAEKMPGMSLVLSEGNKSIKDLEIIDVLDYTPAPKGEGRNTFAEGTKKLKPEFEGTKFAPRALSGSARRSARVSANRAAVSTDSAQALSALFGKVIKNTAG